MTEIKRKLERKETEVTTLSNKELHDRSNKILSIVTLISIIALLIVAIYCIGTLSQYFLPALAIIVIFYFIGLFVSIKLDPYGDVEGMM